MPILKNNTEQGVYGQECYSKVNNNKGFISFVRFIYENNLSLSFCSIKMQYVFKVHLELGTYLERQTLRYQMFCTTEYCRLQNVRKYISKLSSKLFQCYFIQVTQVVTMALCACLSLHIRPLVHSDFQ